MKKYRCTVCGYIHEGELTADFVCPKCKKPASFFEEVVEEKAAGNPYAGTKTEKNLMDAFAGESQARNKYTYFAEVARREGYEQLAEIFLQTARNEQEHARLWFEALNGIGNTAENGLGAAHLHIQGRSAGALKGHRQHTGSRCLAAQLGRKTDFEIGKTHRANAFAEAYHR